MTLAGLPWRLLRRTYKVFRRWFFTTNPPSGPYIHVDRPLIIVERVLGENYFAPNWEFSYYYYGENLNLARVEKNGDSWMQTHVRGFEQDDGSILLTGHWEYEPTEHPKQHLREVDLDVTRGMMNLTRVLDRAGMEYNQV